MYLEHFLLSESAAAWSGLRTDVNKLLEASVSMQVVSQTRRFLLENGEIVTPSGNLPSSRDRPVGSKIDRKPLVSLVRLIMQFRA